MSLSFKKTGNVRITIIAVEDQKILNFVCVCVWGGGGS
jgi:hypothetical protein